MISSENHIDCENHPAHPAVAFCGVCGKPVCGDCVVTAAERQVCNDPIHHAIAREFILLGICANVFDADLLSQNLSAHGILNFRFDPKYYFGTDPVRVFVKQESIGQSRELLASLDLADFLIPHTYGQ